MLKTKTETMINQNVDDFFKIRSWEESEFFVSVDHKREER